MTTHFEQIMKARGNMQIVSLIIPRDTTAMAVEERLSGVFDRYSNSHKDLVWDVLPANGGSKYVLYGKERGSGDYKEAIVGRIDRQIAKGKEKYKTRLEDNVSLTFDERIEHLAEELTDGLQYIEHMKAGRYEIIEEMTSLVAHMASTANINNDERLLEYAQRLDAIRHML